MPEASSEATVLARTECHDGRVLVTEFARVDLRSHPDESFPAMRYQTYEQLGWGVQHAVMFYVTEAEALRNHWRLVAALGGDWSETAFPIK